MRSSKHCGGDEFWPLIVEFLQMDARAIPFAGHFDIIGMPVVLEHLEEGRGVPAQRIK